MKPRRSFHSSHPAVKAAEHAVIEAFCQMPLKLSPEHRHRSRGP